LKIDRKFFEVWSESGIQIFDLMEFGGKDGRLENGLDLNSGSGFQEGGGKNVSRQQS
jgi:hypothetical protein